MTLNTLLIADEPSPFSFFVSSHIDIGNFADATIIQASKHTDLYRNTHTECERESERACAEHDP